MTVKMVDNLRLTQPNFEALSLNCAIKCLSYFFKQTDLLDELVQCPAFCGQDQIEDCLGEFHLMVFSH